MFSSNFSFSFSNYVILLFPSSVFSSLFFSGSMSLDSFIIIDISYCSIVLAPNDIFRTLMVITPGDFANNQTIKVFHCYTLLECDKSFDKI